MGTSKRLIYATVSDFVLLSEFLGDEFGMPEYLEFIDRLQMILNNQNVIHLRSSGNSPELRCN